MVMGSVIGTVLGVLVGAGGAIRQYRLSDCFTTVVSLLVLTAPMFVIANLLKFVALEVNSVLGHQLFQYTGETSPDRGRWNVEPARRSGAASGVAHLDARTGGDRRLQPLPTQCHARCAGARNFIRTARAKGLTRSGAVQTRSAHRAHPDGHAVRLQRRRIVHRRTFVETIFGWHGVGEWVVARHCHPGHQYGRRDHRVPGVLMLVVGLLSDVIYAILDRRVRVA